MKTTLLPLPKPAITQDYTLIDHCQICGNTAERITSLEDLPLVDMLPSGKSIGFSAKYPAPILYCTDCQLMQLGCIVKSYLLFPPDYPYTSGTTRTLCDNFSELARECVEICNLQKKDLVADIGCNDGTLLSYFKKHCRVAGVTPEDMGQLARHKGIPVLQSFLNDDAIKDMLSQHGPASIVTATNVFAHMPNVHEAIECILELLAPGGVLVTESDYLFALLEYLQYDTIHHEHLRYYSLTSLIRLFDEHGLEVIHAKQIPTHGGSLRVYAARREDRSVHKSVAILTAAERNQHLNQQTLQDFAIGIEENKLQLKSLLSNLKQTNKRIYGVGAPGRATVLINHVGIDETILDCTAEVHGSHKIGKYIPGTRIPIVREEKLLTDAPEYALVLSWHIADELMTKLKAKGFRGDFIIPLPHPRIIQNHTI